MTVSLTEISSKATFCALRNALDNVLFRTDVREKCPSESLPERGWREDADRPGVLESGEGWRIPFAKETLF